MQTLLASSSQLLEHFSDMLKKADRFQALAEAFYATTSAEVEESARHWVAIQSAIGVAAHAGRTGQVPKYIPAIEIPQL